MNVKNSSFLRIILAIVIASFISLSIHIFLLGWIKPIIALKMQGIIIPHPPYSQFINFMAYATIFIPVSAVSFGYYIVGDRISCDNRLLKGLILGTFILLIKGALIREPLMNLLVGNPTTIVLLQQSQVWISNFSMAIVIAFIINPLQSEKSKKCI